jgi:imidazole glycerol-phosphate synthase subunit HisF
MRARRIIPVLLHKNDHLVLSRRFSLHQAIGNAFAIADRYKAWDLDELIYLDITPHWSDEGRDAIFDRYVETIRRISRNCFIPLTAGGGIRSVEDINRLIHAGADRIVLNSAALANPDLITQAARVFGAQAVIVGIDAKNGEVFADGGKKPTGRTASEWAAEAERRGAGEIFIQSIERDGIATGFDEALIKTVLKAVRVPIIACGGAGNAKDLERPLIWGAQAVAAANLFAFTELSYLQAKDAIGQDGVAIRPPAIGMDYVAARKQRESGSRLKAEQMPLWQALGRGGLME